MSDLLKQLGSLCWYCGCELVPNAKRVKDENGDGTALAHIDTRREMNRDRHDGFFVLSCRSCRSRRKGKSLEDYRRWLAMQSDEGRRWQAFASALNTPNLLMDERSIIEKKMNEINKVLAGFKFFAEKLCENQSR